MAVLLAKESIDLGIVTTQPERMLTFYSEILGFAKIVEITLPHGGHMYQLACGTSLIKIVVNGKHPVVNAIPGCIPNATGYRYFTITVTNLHELVALCREAGSIIVFSAREIRPGVVIAMVEDPDGNWVEFLQNG